MRDRKECCHKYRQNYQGKARRKPDKEYNKERQRGRFQRIGYASRYFNKSTCSIILNIEF